MSASVTNQRHQGTQRKGTKTRKIRGWFLFFLLADILIFSGFAIIYSESKGWERDIKHAVAVQTITADTSGIVAIKGALKSSAPARDDDLTDSYAILVKEDRNWSCNSRKCRYVAVMTSTIGDVNGLSVNGISLQPSVFRLTGLEVPLLEGSLRDSDQTVENGNILVVSQKETARSYAGVRNGEEVTVIGEAVDGQLKPMAFPEGTDSVLYAGLAPYVPKDMPERIESGYVVGSSLEAIIEHELNMQNSVIWTLLIVGLLLLPVTLLFAPWPRSRRSRAG